MVLNKEKLAGILKNIIGFQIKCNNNKKIQAQMRQADPV